MPIDDATLTQLQLLVENGTLTSHALVQHALDRIAALDKKGPMLNAVIELNPDALAIADALDEGRKSGAPHGPLYGVPVLIKDNIGTADAMQTTAGSLALVGHPPRRDAFIVQRLRQAGAVILGKTNLSEWANFRSTHSVSGWSGRGGQTRNPYAPERNPCGSSSGSGVAVAAGYVSIAVGTETDGSIVCPGSVNGLVGIKPTVGLVSRSGIVPISTSQDTAGPMARNVSDAAAMLAVLAAPDTEDRATSPRHPQLPAGCWFCKLDATSLKGARIGVVRKMAGFSPQVDERFKEAIAAITRAGGVIVDNVVLPHQGEYDKDETLVLQYEFKDGINHYLSMFEKNSRAPHSLADLIAFNSRESAREMPDFGQELFEQSQARGKLTDSVYLKARARARRLAGPEGIDAALKAHHLDALIAPTMGPAWITDPVNGDAFVGGSASTPPAVAGYPHITVPMGSVAGLPVGLSFFGRAWSDVKLIGYAYAYEQTTQARRPPALY